jgi:hypothetical protein
MVSAFDKDKKTGGLKKKTLDLIVMAYDLNDKDKIGSIEIDISEMFGERNKDLTYDLVD